MKIYGSQSCMGYVSPYVLYYIKSIHKKFSDLIL